MFLQDTPAYDGIAPNWVWLQMDQQYRQDKHSMKFWTFTVTMSLNAAKKFFSQSTSAYHDAPYDCIWLQKDPQLR